MPALILDIHPSSALRCLVYAIPLILFASATMLAITSQVLFVLPALVAFVCLAVLFLAPSFMRRMTGRFTLASSSTGWIWTTVRRQDDVVESWDLLDWYRTPWLVVLYLRRRDGGRDRAAVVLPRDALSPMDHRRLRVCLWQLRAEPGATEDQAA